MALRHAIAGIPCPEFVWARLLLDTRLVLRWRVQAPDAEVFVSQASLWEMAIQVSIGRLQVDLPELGENDAAAECG